MTLNQIRNIVNHLINDRFSDRKELSVTRFSELLQVINLDYFEEKVRGKEYKSLRPFKVVLGEDDQPPLSIDSEGMATLPDDFHDFISVLYRYQKDGVTKERHVDIVDSETWHRTLQSSIEYPTRHYPVANIQDGYVRFRPKNLRYVACTYIKPPTEPVFGYKVQDGVMVYDSATATELQWRETEQIDILLRLLKYLGIHAQREDIIALANQEIMQNEVVK